MSETNNSDQLAALLSLVASMRQQMDQMHRLQVDTLGELAALKQSYHDLAMTVKSVANAISNKDRRFYTTISDLPREVMARILVWLDPLRVLKLRSLSRSFDLLLRDKRFARDSFKIHDHRPCTAKETTSKAPTSFDTAWFAWPQEYQEEYISHRLLHLEEIAWNAISFPKFPTIPHLIGTLTNLHHLTLFRCKLIGSIPPEIGSLLNLITLRLDDNNLSGPIPPEIGSLSKLVFLCLDHNKLTGKIPGELGRLVNLRLLNLKCNKLTGSIPGDLYALDKLQNLYLSTNVLDFTIPPEIVAGSVVYNLMRRDGFR